MQGESNEGREYNFEPYNGWPNKMTWTVFTTFGSYSDTYTTLRTLAEHNGQEAVKTQVLAWKDQWFESSGVPEGVNVFMQSILSLGIDYAAWWRITDTLQGGSKLEIDNPFTQVMYEAVKSMDWQSALAEPAKPDETEPIEKQVDWWLSSFDERLRDYCRTLLLMWADSRSRRLQTPAKTLAKQITTIYLEQIVWEKVTSAMKGV
jgi:hypothetical protein